MKIFVLVLLILLGQPFTYADGNAALSAKDVELLQLWRDTPIAISFSDTSAALDKAISMENEQFRVLGEKICSTYKEDGSNVAKNVKYLIIEHMKQHECISEPIDPEIIQFLNRNKNKILCDNGTKTYMMAAFDDSAYDQLFRNLFASESMRPNMNGIAPAGEQGEPMTLLDYVDIQLEDSTRSDSFKREVKSLREMFIEYFSAKKFSELSESERNKYLAK